jgi:hypothetical protein
MTPAKLSLRLVLLSLRRRLRCDDNRRGRGFLVVAATCSTRSHIRPPRTAARRTCTAHRFTIRAQARIHAARGQS